MTDRPTILMPKLEPIQYPTEKLNMIRRTWRWITYTRKWKVIEDYYFILPDGTKVMIPKGFEFDGASVPKHLRGLLSPTGALFLAGLFHDYGYRYNKLIGVNEDSSHYDYIPGAGKIYWDGLFRKISNQTNGLKRINKVAYVMLSLFGFWSWNKHRGRIPKLNLMG